jgi:hypothetical protein
MGVLNRRKNIEGPVLVLNRRIIIPEMSCRYCLFWLSARKSGYEDDTKNSARTKVCNYSKKKEVGLDTKSCSHFELYHIFQCRRRNQQQDIKACIHRLNNSSAMVIFKDCQDCKQGEKIREYMEQKALKEKRERGKK